MSLNPAAADVREQIKNTRAELAETIGQLSDKADVKARASAKAHDAADKLTDVAAKAYDAAPPQVSHGLDIAAEKMAPAFSGAKARAKANPKQAAIIVGVVVVLIVWRRKRKRAA